MRIFSPMMGFNPDSSMGGEIYDVELLKRLASRGHEIDIVLRNGFPSMEAKNISINRFLPNMKTCVYSTVFLPWIFRTSAMKKLMEQSDVFRVHSPYFLGLGSVVSGKRPLWFNYHHIENSLQMGVFDKWLPRHANGITAVNRDTLKDLFRKCPEAEEKVTAVVPNGIDTGLFKPVKQSIRPELGIRETDKLVLFTGSLIERKGVDVLLESWKSVSESYKNAHLLVIGKGPLEGMVREYQKSAERIYHISYVKDRKDLPKYYGSADVFAFPTRLEGFGLTVGEAMACGTPVVTTDAKGVRDVVDDKTGFRVPVNDVKQFSEKLETLLEDEPLRRKMGRNCVSRIRDNFSWETSADEAESFMKQLVK
jgi:glycosyltransferase involved in cell wall biosynthesis